MVKVDLHVHPSPWQNGPSSFHSFALAARDHGIDILGFSEHGPRSDPDHIYQGLQEADLEAYLQAIETVKDEFRGSLQIFCGLELDYHPQSLELYRKLKENYPFDYFYVGIHNIDNWYLDKPETIKRSVHRHKNAAELYELYYREIEKAAKTGLFSGIVHLDYIRRSLPHPPALPPECSALIFPRVAGVIARQNIVVEINTRGKTLPNVGEMYPTYPLVKALARAGVRFTVGSDAHEEVRVGEGLTEARRILLEAQQDFVCYFKQFKLYELEI